MSKTSGSASSGPSSSSSASQTPGVAVMPAEDNFDFLFKIVLIGDCGTGKTCVVQRFKSGTYAENQGNTIGVDFSMKTIKIDGKKVKVKTHPARFFTVSHRVSRIFVCVFVFIASDMGHGWPREVPYNHAELLSLCQRRPVR